MNILIDIGHPAHIHLFKHFAWEMIRKGHQILFTCREKEFEIVLLKYFGFSYKSFGRKYKSSLGKIWGMFEFDLKEYITGLKFKPDILLSHGSIYAAHAAFLLRKPHISMEDTYNFEQVRLYKPFTEFILTSNYEHPLKTSKVITYAGYHELAYLHPKRFIPDESILNELGIINGEKYVIIRFVSWNASHDIGHTGICYENKIKAVEEFGRFAKVFISSEKELPVSLERFRIPIKPHRIHDAIAFASLVFGESSTMVEEAAMLGVPGIYLFNNSTFYTKHLEQQHGLIFNYSESESDQESAIDKAIELIKDTDINSIWQLKRQKLLEQKIDVTAFLVWFIENYPQSAKIMKENPNYQYNFK